MVSLFFILITTYYTLFFISTSVSSIRIIPCNNGTNKLANDEYILFQTPDYPKLYLFDSGNYPHPPVDNYKATECNNTFIRSDGKTNLWFVFLNGFITNFDISVIHFNWNQGVTPGIRWNKMPPWFTYLSPTSELFFNQAHTVFNSYDLSKNIKIEEWSGFQALVYAPNKDEMCPLNSINVFLSDSKDNIVPIASNFYYPNLKSENISATSCSWVFAISVGYKLKINIKQLNFTNDQKLTLRSNIGTVRNLDTIGVQYFDGSDFTIFYNQTSPTYSNYGFGGIVTTIKSEPTIAKNSCISTKNKFTNFNLTNGYADNTICENQITVPKNKTLLLHYQGYLEDGADTLLARDSNKNLTDITQASYWMSDGNVTLEFKSDGSINQGGFTVSNENPSCKCLKNELFSACQMEKFYYDTLNIMENSINSEYCSNMKCLNKISYDKECSHHTIILIPRLRLRYSSNDSVKILKNDKNLAQINPQTQLIDDYFYKQTDKITIDFQSDSSTGGIYPAPQAKFDIYLLKNLKPKVIYLTETKFTHTIELTWLNYDMITVNAPVKYTLDMFLIEKEKEFETLDMSYVYDSNSTSNMISRLDELPLHPMHKQLKYYSSISGSITLLLFFLYQAQATVFFRLREIHAKNCASSDNVITPFDSPITFNALSTGSCFFSIIYCFDVEYSNFLTNSKVNVSFVHEVDASHVIFEFNSETSNKWQKLYLNTIAYSFIIPTNSTLSFASAPIKSDGESYYSAEKGILTSYLGLDPTEHTIYSRNPKVEVPSYKSCKLTAKYIDISSNISISVWTNNDKVIIPDLNIPVTIKNSGNNTIFVEIEYSEYNISRRGYVIEYEIFTANANRLFYLPLLYVFLFLLLQ